MKELAQIRRELDQTDRALVALFEQRMNLSRQVAAYKLAHGLPVLDASREAQVLESRRAMLKDSAWAPAVTELYETLMALSRREQGRLTAEAEEAGKS